MAIDMLYFAWVRERIGRGAETVTPPAEVATVSALIDWLATLSDGHAAALGDRERLRAAVDQRFVHLDVSLADSREVALFPPVTGG